MSSFLNHIVEGAFEAEHSELGLLCGPQGGPAWKGCGEVHKVVLHSMYMDIVLIALIATPTNWTRHRGPFAIVICEKLCRGKRHCPDADERHAHISKCITAKLAE